MKKLLLTAAMIAATVCATAQTSPQRFAEDSIAMRQVAHMNAALRQHAKLAALSAPVMIAGVAIFAANQTTPADATQWDAQRAKNWKTVGIATMTAGGVLFLASYAPLLRLERVSFDERGLVIDIDKPKKRKR